MKELGFCQNSKNLIFGPVLGPPNSQNSCKNVKYKKQKNTPPPLKKQINNNNNNNNNNTNNNNNNNNTNNNYYYNYPETRKYWVDV